MKDLVHIDGWFHEIPRAQAREYLHRYLDECSDYLNEIKPQAAAGGVGLEFELKSMTSVLHWLFDQTNGVAVSPVMCRKTRAKKFLSRFSPRNQLDLAASYYFGEAFRHTYPSLRWDIGPEKTMFENLPCLEGFTKGYCYSPVFFVCGTFTVFRLGGAPQDWSANNWMRWLPDAPAVSASRSG